MKQSELARRAKNAYYREWRKKNPEKVQAANERYWAKKRKQRTEQKQEQNEGNTDV